MKKTRSSDEPATPVATQRDKSARDQQPVWTWFTENPPGDEPVEDQPGRPASGASSKGFGSWFTGPIAALLIPYLLMVLGVACIVALELARSPEAAPAEPPPVTVDFVPAEVQATAYSSPAGGAWTGNE